MFLNLKSLNCIFGVMFLKLVLPSQAQLDISRAGILKVVGDKEYFVEKAAKLNWFKATQVCAALKMTLASIESATEQQNLKNLLFTSSDLSKSYWLSGTDLPLSREFVWFGSGSLFSYTSWASGIRPNYAQRCVRTDGNFNWRRDSCYSTNYFICERPVMPACGVEGQCNKTPLIIF